MKFAVLGAAAALPAAVAYNLPRQGPASSASSVPAAASGSSSTAAGVPGYPAGVSVASSFSALPSVSWSLPSTNPTALPLSDIVPGTITTQPQIGATTTFPAGTAPTDIPNAPPMPNWALLSPANYPPLDKPPPTDSPEVQQWIQDVQNSGIQIPNLEPTQPGGCPANPQFATDQSRCWWTCGGCVRDTDITTCPDKFTWGLTYDDGPALYTPNLLEYLDQNNLKSTMFVVGSRVISYPALLQEEYMAGHQICVHTWSHPSLTTLTNEEIIAEFGWSKKVIKDVLGVTPLYWRPPYGDIDDRVRAIGQAMGMEPVIWTRLSPLATFDTNDYNIAGGTVSVTQVLQNWQDIMGNVSSINTGFIVLEHDLFAQTVDLATGYILPAALAFQPKLDIKPVVECLNKPMQDAYLETNDNSTNPLPTGSNISPTFTSGAPGSAQASGNTTGGASTPQKTGGASSAASPLLAVGTAAAALLVACSVLL
ncbi:carbohydrate esterase-like protein [Phanerochaete sordida]|uniref:chitin deacetylase n=1 Tax=Phanerochaete sordida TaxID=48140 RepID=A0A9P3G562_9APHY|nr:carbohydrate esterase-like protein [Phanerochaete sordida]